MNSKDGILETIEGKFFAGIIANKIPVNGIYKTGLKLVLPIFINSLDDKVGDKIPEPWQTYIEDMVTAVYVAMQDGVITDEEQEQILEKCSAVINAEVDLPLLNEEDEAVAFMFLLKSIASLVKSTFKKEA